MTPISTPTLTGPLASALALPTISTSPTSQEAARQRQAAKAKDALTALQTMREQKSSASDERKAAARKKVEDLKARIRALQMAAVGNPESVARLAAQLARELGAAVKAYGAAGGSTAAMGGSSISVAGPVATAAPEGEAAAGQAVMVEPATPAPASEADTSDKGAANLRDPYRQVIERQQAQTAEQAHRNADKEADSKFAADVKGLAAQLKAILHQAAERAKRDGDRAGSADVQTARKALNQVTDTLGELDASIPNVGGSFSVQV